MRIQYCSDLHLEFPENNKFMKNNPLVPGADVLVLAGDVLAFAIMNNRSAFFDYISANFPVTYWIPGNHEYYDADVSERSGSMLEKIRDNVFLVNNKTIELGSTRFIFSTMWSNISDDNCDRVENFISDFRAIHYHGKLFTATIFNQLHNECMRFITSTLQKQWSGTTVVVTHHVPTFLHYPKKYKGDSLNEVFAVDAGLLIEQTRPDYWIYGHHHSNTAPFKIGSTTLLTNQLGYVHHYEYGSFDGTKYIEV